MGGEQHTGAGNGLAAGGAATPDDALAIRRLAESALLVVLGERIDRAINARALALAAALEEAGIPGVADVVPSYATVLVSFDPAIVDGDDLAAAIRDLAAGLGDAARPPGREVAIPVRYGGEVGPDLAEVAAHVGMAADEVIERHAGAEYLVACMGFSPGFAYLLGLPDDLRVPRRSTPRTRVPAGSVAIGGAQTGVYPLATPGGWNVIGHTDVALFDPAREEPILLRPGDRLRFVPVGEGADAGSAEVTIRDGNAHPAGDCRPAEDAEASGHPGGDSQRASAVRAGLSDDGGHGSPAAGARCIAPAHRDHQPGPDGRAASPSSPEADDPAAAETAHPPRSRPAASATAPIMADSLPGTRQPERVVQIVSPGGVATIQDLGRPGLMRLGVTPGGALDRRALVLGNRLLGNDPGAAALECALAGPTLRFARETLAVVTGADFGARLDGSDVSPWTPFVARTGSVLSFAHPARPGAGVRCYVCVEGGIAVDPVMGSRATDLFGGFGGHEGRPLRAGDVLPLGAALPADARDEALRRRLAGRAPEPTGHGPLRVVLGPQEERFAGEGLAAFRSGRYVVGPRSDRMGLRLAGPPIAIAPGPDMISEGIAAGAIQVPPDGQPIVLLPARQTVGGYPKVATVIGADLDRLGQLAPGDEVRFAAVDVATARAATLAARAALGPEAVRVLRRAVVLAPGLAAESLGWEEAALRRVSDEARAAGVTQVVVDAPGLHVRLASARPVVAPASGRGA